MSTPDPSLPRPHRPTPEALRAALAALRPALAEEEPVLLGEGWDHAAYAVGDRFVLRVLKSVDPVEREAYVERDLRLAAFAEQHSTLPFPRALAALPEAGAILCDRVPGLRADRAGLLDPARAGEQLGGFLRELHDAPLPEAVEATRTDLAEPQPRTMARWLAETTEDFEGQADRAEPGLRREVEEFLAASPPAEAATKSFCHNDLRAEHVLVDPSSGAVAGVVDWSDAVVSDPMRDLALLRAELGDSVADHTLRSYGELLDDGALERVRFGARRALVEELSHHLRVGDPARAERAAARFRQLGA